MCGNMGSGGGVSASGRSGNDEISKVLSGIIPITKQDIIAMNNALPEIIGDNPQQVAEAEAIRKKFINSNAIYAMTHVPYEPTSPTRRELDEKKQNGAIVRQISDNNAQMLVTPKDKVEDFIRQKANESKYIEPLRVAKEWVETQQTVATQLKRVYEVAGKKKTAKWWKTYGDKTITADESRRYILTGQFKDGLPRLGK